MKKKVTAPLSYDPGKGRPKEHLAYLNWQEMQQLQRLNGGNMERGPRGLPSFPPADAKGSSSKASSSSKPSGGGGRDSGSRDKGGAGTYKGVSGKGAGASTSRSSGPSTRGPVSRIPSSPGRAAKPSGGKISPSKAYRPSNISPGGLASPGVPSIARAMNFQQSLAGVRDPKLAKSIKDAALTNKSIFSIKGATPQQQSLVDRISPTVLQVSMDTGLDPRTIVGQALTESTTAKHESKVSKLARDANNLFGVKATGATNEFWGGDVVYMPTKEVIKGKTVTVKEPFRRYDSPEQALMDYGRLMQTNRYKNASKYSTPEDQLRAIRAGGFATHPSKSYVDMGVRNVARISVGDKPMSFSAASSVVPASANIQPSGFTRMSPATQLALRGAVAAGKVLGSPSDYKIPSIKEQTAFVKSLPDSVKLARVGTEAQKLGQKLPSYFASGVGSIGRGLASVTGGRPSVQQASADSISAPAGTGEAQFQPYGMTVEQQKEFDKYGKRVERTGQASGLAANLVFPGLGFGARMAGKAINKAAEAKINKYVASTPSERAEQERKDPSLIGWASALGIQPQNDYSVYQSWAAERGLRGAGESRGEQQGDQGDVRYAGGIGSLPSASVPLSTQPSTPSTAAPSGPRPYQYYQWDVGVNIPSPTDPSYTSYQEYLRRRAQAQA